jgi:hypothetical protein
MELVKYQEKGKNDREVTHGRRDITSVLSTAKPLLHTSHGATCWGYSVLG